MRGWFDAFREGGGPTLYDSARTAATHDNILLALYTTFAALFLAFLLIIPGIRRNKLPTLVLLTGSMYVVASIVICLFSSNWHVASSNILASYKHSTGRKLPGLIAVHIGLDSFNVTLELFELNNTNGDDSNPLVASSSGLLFNERYSWIEVDEVKKVYHASLERGFPFPILTIAETLAMDEAGFSWGRSYRLAGYYCSIFLWSALASWTVTNILFCLVPRYSGYFMLLTAGLVFSANAIYAQLLPTPPLTVRFEQGLLTFDFGWCFWMTLTAGFVCVIYGVGTVVSEIFFPDLLSDVYSSWKYTNETCSATFPYIPSNRPPATSISLNVCDSPEPKSRPEPSTPRKDLPLSTSLQWSSAMLNSQQHGGQNDTNLQPDPHACTIVDDPLLEEIDRASNLPYKHNLPGSSIVSPYLDSRIDIAPSSSQTHHAVIRDGEGYVNPVMWDINVALQDEKAQEPEGEFTRL